MRLLNLLQSIIQKKETRSDYIELITILNNNGIYG